MTRSAIVLCGGQSSRFGADKALALWNGRTLLARAIETARSVAGEVMLAVGPSPRYADFECPIVIDSAVGQGPLAGIVAGLERATTDIFVVLAVDLPLVTPETIDVLLAHLEGEVDLVMPRSGRGLEPLCCVGRHEPCLAAGRKLLESGTFSPRLLMNEVNGLEFAIDKAGADPFVNVNTPGELARAGSPVPSDKEEV
jgi:molybdopterin-guanine dinucleotide biosynthesis protein A